jgi:hypothetical protein
MGVITWRRIARKEEHVIFPAIPLDWGFMGQFKPSQAQKCLLKDVSSRRALYAAPYGLAGIARSAELDGQGTAYRAAHHVERQVGLDLKYGLSSNVTLDLTVNTDFAQVEADDQQVNLTRASLFFPEKRLFFQERASSFDFSFDEPNRVFYSRRIGLHDGELIRIHGGVRVVGRVGKWDFGALSMQTAATRDAPSENFGVVRLRRQILNRFSYAGGVVTTRFGADGGHNVVYGLDGLLRLFGDDYLTLKWAQSFKGGGDNSVLSLDPARIHVNWERRTLNGLRYFIGASHVGPQYNPGAGFENREDYHSVWGVLQYGWWPGGTSRLLTHRLLADGYVVWRGEDGSVESADAGPAWEFESKSGFFGSVSPRMSYENLAEPLVLSDHAEVPPASYTFYRLAASLSTPGGRSVGATIDAGGGCFYDGRLVLAALAVRWNATASLTTQATYEFNDASFPSRRQQFTSHIGRIRVQYTPTTAIAVTVLVQYSSAVDAVTANLRARYNPREGIDLYLAYDEILNTDRFRTIPTLPFSSNRTLMLKYVHTLVF